MDWPAKWPLLHIILTRWLGDGVFAPKGCMWPKEDSGRDTSDLSSMPKKKQAIRALGM
jgi:hypothetical protein